MKINFEVQDEAEGEQNCESVSLDIIKLIFVQHIMAPYVYASHFVAHMSNCILHEKFLNLFN